MKVVASILRLLARTLEFNTLVTFPSLCRRKLPDVCIAASLELRSSKISIFIPLADISPSATCPWDAIVTVPDVATNATGPSMEIESDRSFANARRAASKCVEPSISMIVPTESERAPAAVIRTFPGACMLRITKSFWS